MATPNGEGTASPCPYEVAVGERIPAGDWDGRLARARRCGKCDGMDKGSPCLYEVAVGE